MIFLLIFISLLMESINLRSELFNISFQFIVLLFKLFICSVNFKSLFYFILMSLEFFLLLFNILFHFLYDSLLPLFLLFLSFLYFTNIVFIPCLDIFQSLPKLVNFRSKALIFLTQFLNFLLVLRDLKLVIIAL